MAFPDFSAWISSPTDWVILMACAMAIGMSKTGLQGLTILIVPILALTFGARESTGLILPILCAADLAAVAYFRRSAQWKYILRLLPPAIAGFFIAIAADRFIPVHLFRYLMALCIFVAIAFLLWSRRSKQAERITRSWWYTALFGLVGGFTSMIGNAAGPILSVYLLSMRLPKYAFVGTGAWFFVVINFLKLPIQIIFWQNITLNSAALSLTTLPAIALGAVIGISFVHRIPERAYRIFIISVTILSTLLLLF